MSFLLLANAINPLSFSCHHGNVFSTSKNSKNFIRRFCTAAGVCVCVRVFVPLAIDCKMQLNRCAVVRHTYDGGSMNAPRWIIIVFNNRLCNCHVDCAYHYQTRCWLADWLAVLKSRNICIKSVNRSARASAHICRKPSPAVVVFIRVYVFFSAA